MRMPEPVASIELTADEQHRLTSWVRAGTTPQRLARRARLILGSAAGLGSRALARQERMSRTTVRRWLGRFATQRCAGLQDRPRRGRPKRITPATRALVVALACERPADREVPLRRYSLSELAVEIATRLPSQQSAPSRTAIWRVLAHDALRPWRYPSRQLEPPGCYGGRVSILEARRYSQSHYRSQHRNQTVAFVKKMVSIFIAYISIFVNKV